MLSFQIPGGISPDLSNKLDSTAEPIGKIPLAERLVVPLRQNSGAPPKCVIRPGDRVLKGQPLAIPNAWVSSSVHAPTSGIVEAVEDYPIPHPSGLPDRCVVISSDGMNQSFESKPLDWQNSDWKTIRQAIREAGVVGLGGSVFPTDIKIHPPIKILVINGAECEPYITCDDMLMRAHADEIMIGVLILKRALGAETVMIGIEDDKPQAIEAMTRAADKLDRSEHVSVHVIQARYPSGYAKQLIYLLTGIEIDTTTRSYDRGVQCFNVGTTYSIYRAIVCGKPQTSRIVTVTGNVEAPRNYWVPIGTPIDHLLSFCRPKPDTDAIVMGGPMMGFPLASTSMPVVKACSCLLATSKTLFPRRGAAIPCIRCGACATACPVNLSPYSMAAYIRAKRFDDVKEHHLFDCIECGCCSYVCPSNIPLVHYFKYAKAEIYEAQIEESDAILAKRNAERKRLRLERAAKEKAERAAKRSAPKTTTGTGDGNDRADVAAAIERVKAKRAVASAPEPGLAKNASDDSQEKPS